MSDEDRILALAKIIEARRGLNHLLDAAGGRKTWLVELCTSVDGGNIFDTETMIPADIVILGLHRMAEECLRQITLALSGPGLTAMLPTDGIPDHVQTIVISTDGGRG